MATPNSKRPLPETSTPAKRARLDPEVTPSSSPASFSGGSEKTDLDAEAKWLYLQGFQACLCIPKIIPRLKDVQIASPRPGSFVRNPVGDFKRLFLSVNPPEIFAYVAERTTLRMDEKVRLKLVKGQNATRYYSDPVTIEEILVILGLQIIFRGRANIKTIPDQFKVLPDSLSDWPIAEKRYKAIISSLDVDFADFS